MDRYPLHALRQLLASEQPIRGVITAISSQRATVATPSGARTVMTGSQALKVGQAVTIRQGVAYPSARPADRYVV